MSSDWRQKWLRGSAIWLQATGLPQPLGVLASWEAFFEITKTALWGICKLEEVEGVSAKSTLAQLIIALAQHYIGRELTLDEKMAILRKRRKLRNIAAEFLDSEQARDMLVKENVDKPLKEEADRANVNKEIAIALRDFAKQKKGDVWQRWGARRWSQEA